MENSVQDCLPYILLAHGPYSPANTYFCTSVLDVEAQYVEI